MTEFSDRPFVAGSIVGLRAFKSDDLGRLTGVTVQTVWTPGENVAECRKPDDGWNALWSGMNVRYSIGGWVASPAYGVTPPAPPPTVTSPLAPTGGMRYDSKKKRYVPDPTAGRLVPRATPEPEKAEPDKGGHDLISLGCTCGFYAYFDGSNEYHESAGALGITGIIEGYGRVVAGSRGFRCEKARIVALVTPKPVDDVALEARQAIRWQRVQANYGISVYPSITVAVNAHPLSAHMLPTPETDEDFWTRSAS